jgi:hypothetical protein
MAAPYTRIHGLSFPKGSDQDYAEEWKLTPTSPVVRKTIQGDQLLKGGKGLWSLTLGGSGDVLPTCELTLGDMLTLIPPHSHTPIMMRFETWGYRHTPWQFCYTWNYSFIEMEKTTCGD